MKVFAIQKEEETEQEVMLQQERESQRMNENMESKEVKK